MSHSYFKKGRRDMCEKEILDYLKSRGYFYLMLGLGQGADFLLFAWGDVIFVEVKNLNTTVTRKKLTETEKKVKQYCDMHETSYLVIHSVEEMEIALNKMEYYHRKTVELLSGDYSFEGLIP